MLDNIPHVKAFWIATGVEIAQMALWFGADDLDGTVQEEKIYHMAGSRTPESLGTRRHPAPHSRGRPRCRSSATRCTTSSRGRTRHSFVDAGRGFSPGRRAGPEGPAYTDGSRMVS